MSKPKVIARCGDNQHAPESTLAAFESAIFKGADGIELDVQMSRDEQLIIHHDYLLGRTENAQGMLSDFDFVLGVKQNLFRK